MTSIVTLAHATAHLRLDSSDDADLVQHLIDACEESVAAYLNRPLSPWTTDTSPPPLPLAVQQAILLLVADLYENRSAQVEKSLSLNPTVDRLLYPHRLGLGF